ncbi:cell division protein SepF [Methanocaldococcus sp.]|uniref:cell division protein SepF n=1 Tax=Methanocaldococcus sp. TaxID=2152917 RepID=UPI002636762A|nr:cell division protein SepF [Methanocaldococcus sp.]MCQ6254641.1 cell division protein SepF [Methanocaldococcus sp.]
MLEKLKKLFKGKNNENLNPPTPVSIDDYLQDIEELPITSVEDEKIVIKVCSIEDEKDAVTAIVLAEAGYIVIAKTPNLEKEIDDEFIEIIKKIRDEVLKNGGNVIILGDEHLLITPKNVVIEKQKEEPKKNKILEKYIKEEKKN